MDEREHLAALVRSVIVDSALSMRLPCAARVAWSAPIGEDCRHSAEGLDGAEEVRRSPSLCTAARAMAAGDVSGAADALALTRGRFLDEWARETEGTEFARAERRAEAGL